MSNQIGIIFDFNGVIVDDYVIQKEAWNRISQLLRGKPVTDQEMAQYIRGIPTAKIVIWMSKKQLGHQDIAALSRKKSELVKALFETSPLFRLVPGLDNFLDELVRRGLSRTIATSQTRPVFLHLAKQLGLETWFDLSKATCYDGSYPGKPAPDAYILAAKKIGAPPENCIVFEDAHSGIGAAYAAGVRTIVAIGKDEQVQELQKLPGVVKVVHSFNGLGLEDLLALHKDKLLTY